MRPPLARITTVGAAFAGVVLAIVVLAPWESTDPDPVVAEFGLCNISVASIPTGVTARPFPLADHPNAAGVKVWLVLETPRDPEVKSITDPNGRSHIGIDPSSGEIVREFYRSASDRELLGRALDGLHVGPWQLADPSDAIEHPESWRC